MAVALDLEVGKRNDIVDAGLARGKAVWAVEGVITVGHAVPAEVEMEHAVAIVSVANEGMRACR